MSMRLIVWLTLIKGITCVNVLLLMALYSCPQKYKSEEIVDGNRFRLADTITDMCTSGDLVYELDDFYYVHTVVLYGGNDRVHGKIIYGSTFSVNTYNGKDAICGRYLQRRVVVFQGMRVNCESITAPVLKIGLVFTSLPFLLAELEVLTLASGENGEVTMMYRGCFSEFASSLKSEENFQKCGKLCVTQYFIYSAFQRDECHCGYSIDMADLLPDKQCTIPCSSSRFKCGGNNTYSVYLVQVQLPYYKGCARTELKNGVQSDDMTVTKCLQMCDGSFFAILQNGTYCVCIDDESKLSFANVDSCTIPCAGDPNSYCGGSTYWSVYGTCFKNNPPTLSCSKLFHCAKSWDEFGVCEGGCEEHYFGEHCIERVMDYFQVDECISGNFCKHVSNTFCLYNSKRLAHDCACSNGYWDVELNGVCKDIDECIYDVCLALNSLCKNRRGSYVCKCQEGFRLNGGVCREIVGTLLTTSTIPFSTQSGNHTSYVMHTTGDKTLTQPFQTSDIQRSTELSSTSLLSNRSEVSSTSPLSNRSVLICTSDLHSYRCICNDGFWKSENGSCEDIDECTHEACNNKTSKCMNTVGSFVCLCHRNFYRVSTDVCLMNATAEFKVSDKTIFTILVICFLMTNFMFLLCYAWTMEDSDELLNAGD